MVKKKKTICLQRPAKKENDDNNNIKCGKLEDLL